MSRNDSVNQWVKKLAVLFGLLLVFGLPAIYWAGTTFLGVDARASIEGTFKRIFSKGPIETLESLPDDGSD